MTDQEFLDELRTALAKQRWVNDVQLVENDPPLIGVQTYDGDLVFLAVARP